MSYPHLFPQMSEKFDIVLSQLMKAKQAIGTVKKDSKNPFHKSNYASLNAYLDASEGHLLENGLILVQAGNGTFTEPVIVATLIHVESGQWIKSYLPILNPKQDSQGLGASVTYMRRYSLATILGLVSEDDDGETAVGRGKYDKQNKKAEEQKPLTDLSEQHLNLRLLKDVVPEQERDLLMQWVKVVQDHFQWTEPECVKKLLDDKGLISKFNKWKTKTTTTETK